MANNFHDTGELRIVSGVECTIETDGKKFYARNPSGPGYNWVSTGGKYKEVSPDEKLLQTLEVIRKGYQFILGWWRFQGEGKGFTLEEVLGL